MAQFDVYRNTGRQRDVIPFIVVVQSSLFEAYRRVVGVPLVLQSVFGADTGVSLELIAGPCRFGSLESSLWQK